MSWALLAVAGYVDARITSLHDRAFVTLLGSAFNVAPSGTWFPPFVATPIAASIVYMALENIIGVELERRALITGLFGLVHGFGFSYGLKENLSSPGRISSARCSDSTSASNSDNLWFSR